MLRMAAPTVMLALGLLVLGSVAAWYLHHLQREASDLLVASVEKVRSAEELELLSYRLRARLNEFLLTGDRAQLAVVPQLQQEAHQWMEHAKELADNPQELQRIAEIERGYRKFLTEYQKVERKPPAEQERGAIFHLVQQVTKNDILGPASEYRELNQRSMAAASQRGQRIADRMGVTLLLLGMCGAVAGLVAGFGIARGIQRSMVQLAVPIHDATGKLEELVGPVTVFSDPSFHGLEAALQELSQRIGTIVERVHQSHRAAARAEQLAAVGQLAAGLAHELRNPLTSLNVLVQGAAEQGSLEGRDLAIVEDEIGRLNRTIQTLLDYARPPKLEKRPFLLRGVLQQTVELLSHRAEQHRVHLELQLPEADPLITADESQIRQVVVNLVLNAIDASPQGGTIWLSLECESAAISDEAQPDTVSDWMRIDIADEGQGLPAQLAQQIFEPFVSAKETGTGLGLAICKRIVDDHGGRITATNRPQSGALFSVRLPMTPPARPTSTDGTLREAYS